MSKSKYNKRAYFLEYGNRADQNDDADEIFRYEFSPQFVLIVTDSNGHILHFFWVGLHNLEMRMDLVLYLV